MKKILKSLAVFSALALLSGTVLSCSDGDDDNKSTFSPTTGTTGTTVSNDTLNGKKFSYENSKGEARYITIQEGKIYKSDSSESLGNDKSDKYSIISCNSKYYLLDKEDYLPRMSGTGIYATFGAENEGSFTLSSNGTFVAEFTEKGETERVEGTFVNNNGIITFSLTEEGKDGEQEVETQLGYYDGSSLNLSIDELTEVN
ncbi:hypothetical protein [Treponema zioleckii]|uniref:hypothetical protein n=1 Tax=Treponema zioleckii TaxID=331680 RepID=UPI00168BC890|nr:hypothetical protein [Treponema zioleckii]